MRRPRPQRDTVCSFVAAAIYSLSLGIASVALPLLALHVGYGGVEIGLLTAASAVSQFSVRASLGAAMRRWPDKYLVVVAAALMVASNLTVLVSTAVVPFLVAQLLQGASRAAFWTGSQTHVVHGSGRSLGALALMNLAASVGSVIGPLLAGLFSERTPELALLVAAGAALVGMVPGLMLDRLPPFTQPEQRPPGRLWRRPGVDAGCWAGVTTGAWRGLLNSYVPIALDAARQSASVIGVLVTVANGASVIGAGIVGRLRPAAIPRAYAAGVLAAGLGTAATAATAGHVGLSAAVLALSGLGAGALQTLGPSAAADAVGPQERGDVMVVTGTFRAAALLAAPAGVAGLLAVLALGPAMAIAGAAITLPLLATRSLVPRG